ncbi:PilZ domain-containing protein [Gellertiella hungarica]|uniref:PilZ domain-containing protein n=1 Tax=Gellertiella hungarica TaxID=1572859 RepID=A0A7W6J4I7_9HYPH|nr:PilZ domain-containing protein [Gellertiella hungarica]MBB4064650.1 hypothetical protein [Gellertiella hungarica]
MHKNGIRHYAPVIGGQAFGKLKQREQVVREERETCAFTVEINAQEFSGEAEIVNMSRSGMALRTSEKTPHLPGARITVTGPEVGVLAGTARWQRGDEIGVQFDRMTNTKARLKAYFGFLKKRS